jgi:hypothetical protein
MRQLTVDQPLTCSAGTHTVQFSQIRPGVYRVEVLSGGSVAQPVEELTRSYADESLARTIARVITVALRREGATVEDARRAVVQHLDGQLAFLLDSPSIQATNAATYLQMVKGMFESPEDKRWADELAADMVAFHRALRGITTATGDNRSNPSNGDSQPASVQPQTMADTVPSQPHRQVRPTMAGAHLADLTEPQQDAIAAAQRNAGTVLRSGDHPLPVLRALARKGFARLDYAANVGRRKVVESATLTARGWAVA